MILSKQQQSAPTAESCEQRRNPSPLGRFRTPEEPVSAGTAYYTVGNASTSVTLSQAPPLTHNPKVRRNSAARPGTSIVCGGWAVYGRGDVTWLGLPQGGETQQRGPTTASPKLLQKHENEALHSTTTGTRLRTAHYGRESMVMVAAIAHQIVFARILFCRKPGVKLCLQRASSCFSPLY